MYEITTKLGSTVVIQKPDSITLIVGEGGKINWKL